MPDVKRWDGEVQLDRSNRRVGLAPDEVPMDGDWWVMRSTPPVSVKCSKAIRRQHSQRITQAAKYIRTRQRDSGKWPGFEVATVRTDEESDTTWHLVGRWRQEPESEG